MRRNAILGCVLGVLLICCGAVGAAAAAEWVSLFDGQSLDGWTQRGGKAKYSVEDGTIVGRSVPNTPNSFLCTERDYGDFVLEYEFKVDPSLNSGVQIRSQSLPDYRNGRVHGYQVEIDPSDRAWTAGIYDESRRGWLNNLADNEPARKAFRQNEWNRVRVEARGASIKTFLNDVPAADLVDTMTLSGFIALQVHGVGGREEPLEVRWRNLRIQDLGTSAWEPLFDGQSLAGWTATPGGEWKVAEDTIVGTSAASDPRHGILLSDKKYGDFTARIVYKIDQGNSGFYFHVDRVDNPVTVHGFQAEMDVEKDAGGLYETGGRAWVVQPDAKLVEKCFKPRQWNEMMVFAQGGRVVVRVNGQKTAELNDDPGRREGYFGLQLHGGQDMQVAFRSVDLLVAAESQDTTADVVADATVDVVADGAEVEKIAGDFAFTEGPAPGPDGKIYFSDIPNARIHVYDPESGQLDVFREESGKSNGLMFGADGALYACEGGSRQLTRLKNGTWEVLADSYEGKRLNSPNDLDIDENGGVYFTDPRYGNRDDMEMDVEGVYYWSPDGALRRVIDDLIRPNGILLSLDNKTLYVVDNATPRIYAYDVQADRSVTNRRVFADMGGDGGGGDGMSIDAAGNVYCAGRGKVWVWNKTGALLAQIEPPEGPANCVLGGPDGKTLYMTARTGFYKIRLNYAQAP